MSLLVTGSVAAAYASGVVGIHRLSVWVRRQRGRGYSTLAWLDWNVLLEGLVPEGEGVHGEAHPREGGPTPTALKRGKTPGVKVEVLARVVRGEDCPEKAIVEAGFSQADAAWLVQLVEFRTRPSLVAAQLREQGLSTLPRVYLAEWLQLNREINLLNLEWAVFRSKWRLSRSLPQFGEPPCLYLLRAQASALLGQNAPVVDDLARAVYFSREDRMYLEVVNQFPLVQEERPAFARLCREGLERLSGERDV